MTNTENLATGTRVVSKFDSSDHGVIVSNNRGSIEVRWDDRTYNRVGPNDIIGESHDAMTCGEAVRDTSTVLGRHAAETKIQRETVIGQWVALGYTRDEAYKAALFGFRK